MTTNLTPQQRRMAATADKIRNRNAERNTRMTAAAIPQPIAQTADTLEALSNGEYYVRVTERGWINLYASPEKKITPDHLLDFLRLTHDDGTWKLYHFTHNEVLKGEATFSNSLQWVAYEAVSKFFENL